MATARHLTRAPIIEALIDVRVQQRAPLLPEQLLLLQERLSTSYPVHEPIQKIEAKFESHGGRFVPSDSVEEHFGWMFKDADGVQVAQFRTDGFTFNRLRPYTSWESLFPQAMELWSLYVDILKPEQVGRLAVRFINRMADYDPIEAFGLSEPPKLPLALRVATREFLSRLVVLDEETEHSATVTIATDAELPKVRPALILDVDAFATRSYDPRGNAIARTLEELRRLKNKLFFGSITEETARLYE